MKQLSTKQDYLDRYYPVAARDIKTWLGAAVHSLRKWIGNKKFYAVTGRHLEIGGSSCALCRMSKNPNTGFTDCDRCPLPQFQGGQTCSYPYSPYHRAIFQARYEPLIDALRKTANHLITLEAQGKPWDK